MRITELLQKEGIALNVKAETKDAAVDRLVDLQDKAGNISDKEEFKRGILSREESGSTAIADGIAIPHSKNKSVVKAGLAAMTVPEGVDYDSLDGEPSNLFFMIAVPEKGGDLHLEVLSRLSVLLMDETFRKDLLAAKDADAFLHIIDMAEREKFSEEFKKTPDIKNEPVKISYRILAVTACPTGIAHTYMAAEALEKKGKEMGYPLKAETNGSGGAKNVLTPQEIKEADGIIIAADKNVEMARFDGKKVLKTKVSDGIHKPQELIDRLISGDVPVYHHAGGTDKTFETDTESAGRKVYKHLMNGISHMLPFVIGGGILIALAFLFDKYSIDPANFGSNTPLAAFFMRVGKTAFEFMLPVLAGYIAMSIADRPALAVGFVGGAIAKAGMTLTEPTGVSAGFLGALLAGFAAGFLVNILKKLFSKLPRSLEGIKPVLIYPLGGILLIGIFMCAVNPFIGIINTSLTDTLNNMGSTSKILLGCVLGGMMSVDMGGPVNKAAYVFGTASLASSGFDIMAAVMVGGMVPPLVIALCATFFKNRFTKEQRESAMVNYIMGLCFISEGAIPFAAGDPLRVIPSCIIGSAVAGGISMAMHCTLRAPHGGIFVFPTVGNVGGYIVALLIGSAVGALILAALKKPVTE
ncbi:PTS fructose transporter subunit IIABC [Anaerocolumna xylanovorans]|uniref:PTS system D-fructose-specific IIA component (F1P-forming), Frc family /PTS system D-fructose-specific IIB component (F1P-forming), Frc family /PTS system D-fructose-specific IIC component (F1P-for... n=1 Tax=Anaerocolumna xylanovorans DSM 12503 TaxID=1121345 RepID=A0A1M7YDB0_9FIRM|nr:PTS fructose transporter subunit IIABC [Anaerocolumna xylanovorans]SHO50593.1 PTS system D-fructose-specific IIA component (F1P-forming), Frc family /PTS system D-fructose-specific IIB component (F1P-forming), Frc family /PTS system D-fructose-specific IIC component (F1P-forming), Frc family [Anaerocolumna xylanovorans DSM 12503]